MVNRYRKAKKGHDAVLLLLNIKGNKMLMTLLLWYSVFRNIKTTTQELEFPVIKLETSMLEDNYVQRISDPTGVSHWYILRSEKKKRKKKQLYKCISTKMYSESTLFIAHTFFFFAKNA